MQSHRRKFEVVGWQGAMSDECGRRPASIQDANYELAAKAYLLRYFTATVRSFGQEAVIVI